MGAVMVSSLTERLWEVHAMAHVKCSARNLSFAKCSLHVNNGNNNLTAPALVGT